MRTVIPKSVQDNLVLTTAAFLFQHRINICSWWMDEFGQKYLLDK